MREHDARIAAGRQRRGNAGHDFEGDARLGQRADFLRQAAENRRIATLKSDDDAPRAGQLDHPPIDLFLRHDPVTAMPSQAAKFGARRRMNERPRIHQIVI